MRSEQLWRDLRAKNDWAGFLPALEGVVALVREEAALRADALGLDPYDALMEQYDPGNRAADISAGLRRAEDVPRRISCREALAVQEERLAEAPLKPLSGTYPIDRQRELGLAMMAAVGFDLTHGSLSVSHHPFCGGVPTDVRITTRYKTSDFLSALMGVLHETGHALYEQNLPHDWAHWPLGKARGMAMHESQSLFVEKQLGRNPAFWDWALPVVEKHLGESWTHGRHPAACAPRRARADPRRRRRGDLSAARHPALRAGAGAGRRPPRGRPTCRKPGTPRCATISACRPSTIRPTGRCRTCTGRRGAFGYFPSYTLGAMMAAQQWAALAKAHPTAEDDIANGRFDAVNDWRRDNIWSQASRWSTPELLERATGEKLNAGYFIDHLQKRYGALNAVTALRHALPEPGPPLLRSRVNMASLPRAAADSAASGGDNGRGETSVQRLERAGRAVPGQSVQFLRPRRAGDRAGAIRMEWGLSDLQLGIISAAFTVVYAVAGIPLGRLADTRSRKTIMGWGLIVWSGFTRLGAAAVEFRLVPR